MIERNALKGCFLTKIDTDLLELTHQYYLLSVVGKSGPILNELSKQSTFKPDIPEAKESIVWKGLFFNSETHDGSDFFIPEGSQFVFITELAHNKIITAGLENIRMINIADMINLSLR